MRVVSRAGAHCDTESERQAQELQAALAEAQESSSTKVVAQALAKLLGGDKATVTPERTLDIYLNRGQIKGVGSLQDELGAVEDRVWDRLEQRMAHTVDGDIQVRAHYLAIHARVLSLLYAASDNGSGWRRWCRR